MPCLFADDGVLIATDRVTLQEMTEFLADALADVGLFLNAGKTKWMIVAPAEASRADYEVLCAQALLNPLVVGDESVKLVEEFRYLGSVLNWRWNWSASWKVVQDRARALLGKALGCAFQQRAGSLYAQLEFMRATVFTHFDYISAVAGAGGDVRDQGSWPGNEELVTWALRMITGCRFVKPEALRIESGTWDQRSRIDKLLLRFWAKLTAAPVESTHYRAMCLSMESLSHAQVTHPDTTDIRTDRVHRQSWAQLLLAAAGRNDIPQADVLHLRPGLVKVQYRDAPDDDWTTLVHPDDQPGIAGGLNDGGEWRAVRSDAINFGEKRHQKDWTWWPIPSYVDYRQFFRQWKADGPLQLATYATLQQRGNRQRHVAVEEFLQKCRDNRPGFTMLRRYAAISADAFTQAYWHLPDVRAARRLLQVRLDVGPYDGHMRRRDQVERQGRVKQRRLPRLEENIRACYLCDQVDSTVPHVYWPETQEHMLVKCTGMHELRERARTLLKEMAFRQDTLAVVVAASAVTPDFDDDTTLLMVLRLATSAYGPVLRSIPPHSSAVGSDVGARARRSRDDPMQLDMDRARATTQWVRVLMMDWMACVRDRHQHPTQSPGYCVAYLAALHVQNVCSTRRRLLRKRPDFHERARDPAPVLGAPAPRDPIPQPMRAPVAVSVVPADVIFNKRSRQRMPVASVAHGCGAVPVTGLVVAIPV